MEVRNFNPYNIVNSLLDLRYVVERKYGELKKLNNDISVLCNQYEEYPDVINNKDCLEYTMDVANEVHNFFDYDFTLNLNTLIFCSDEKNMSKNLFYAFFTLGLFDNPKPLYSIRENVKQLQQCYKNKDALYYDDNKIRDTKLSNLIDFSIIRDEIIEITFTDNETSITTVPISKELFENLIESFSKYLLTGIIDSNLKFDYIQFFTENIRNKGIEIESLAERYPNIKDLYSFIYSILYEDIITPYTDIYVEHAKDASKQTKIRSSFHKWMKKSMREIHTGCILSSKIEIKLDRHIVGHILTDSLCYSYVYRNIFSLKKVIIASIQQKELFKNYLNDMTTMVLGYAENKEEQKLIYNLMEYNSIPKNVSNNIYDTDIFNKTTNRSQDNPVNVTLNDFLYSGRINTFCIQPCFLQDYFKMIERRNKMLFIGKAHDKKADVLTVKNKDFILHYNIELKNFNSYDTPIAYLMNYIYQDRYCRCYRVFNNCYKLIGEMISTTT